VVGFVHLSACAARRKPLAWWASWPGGLYCSPWAGPYRLQLFLFKFQTENKLQIEKEIFLSLQKFPNFVGWKINSKGTTFLLRRSSYSQHNLNYKFGKQNKLEFVLNLKRVQIFWENPISSPKIFLDMIFNTVNLD
jgi:hypothetical protein